MAIGIAPNEGIRGHTVRVHVGRCGHKAECGESCAPGTGTAESLPGTSSISDAASLLRQYISYNYIVLKLSRLDVEID